MGGRTNVSIANEIGINPKSITRWKKDPKFMHAVVMRSRALLKEDLPEVYKQLSNNSKEGSAQHIKILLDHLESLEKAKSSEATITFTWKKPEPEMEVELKEEEEENE
jgi:hypothetical protein